MNRSMLGMGLVVGTALMMSCGGSSDDPGTPAASGPTLDQLPSMLVTVECSLLSQCAGPWLDLVLAGQDCKSWLLPQAEDKDFAGLKEDIDQGKVVYHPDKVQACLDALKAQGCAAFSNRLPAVCEDAFTGTVAAGGACTRNGQCQGDAYCKADTACPGACATREAEGATCSGDDSCQDGLKCMGSPGKCRKPGGSGASCGAGNPDCDITTICLGADAASKTAGVCKPMTEAFSGKEGDTCKIGDANGPLCQVGVSCVVDTTTPLAFKCAAPSAAGAACKFGLPDACPVGQFCSGLDITKADIDGTCTDVPGEGQPCAVTVGSPSCAKGMVCDDGNVCRTPQRIGGACANNKACYSEYCKGGTCVAGDACPH